MCRAVVESYHFAGRKIVKQTCVVTILHPLFLLFFSVVTHSTWTCSSWIVFYVSGRRLTWFLTPNSYYHKRSASFLLRFWTRAKHSFARKMHGFTLWSYQFYIYSFSTIFHSSGLFARSRWWLKIGYSVCPPCIQNWYLLLFSIRNVYWRAVIVCSVVHLLLARMFCDFRIIYIMDHRNHAFQNFNRIAASFNIVQHIC